VTNPASGPAPDPDRHGRRAVWITFFIAMTIAAIVYKAKAEDDRSAFIRWRHQVLELRHGSNIWDNYYFPNPPIMPISLYPLMTMPPVQGALVWYALKVLLASWCLVTCMRMAVPPGMRFPWWAQAALILLSLRPILGDLHHANNNLIILSLVVATLAAWRKGYDVVAGMCLALAITYKVTPALFVPFFLYKRSWKVVGSTFLGIGVFLLVVPSLVLGHELNMQCLASWYHRILGPFVENGTTSTQEVNQSMVGVVSRLLTASKPAGEHGNAGSQMALNLVSWPPLMVSWFVKGLSVAFVLALAFLCRTKTTRRDDPRLLGEFSLVVLTMLIVSERSWKHHFVTIVLPYAYLVARVAVLPGPRPYRRKIAGLLFLSALLMAFTSSEFGTLFGKNGHKVAQFYGSFLMAGLVLYATTAWRVIAERDRPLPDGDNARPHPLPSPHLASLGKKADRV
jgi:alpha-1,2-mannosyltransferase